MRHHGKEGSLHTKIGYNWRMSDIHAILGIYQLNRLDEFVEKRFDEAFKCWTNSINNSSID